MDRILAQLRFDRLRLVGGDRLLEVVELAAAEEAELVELAEVLLRLGDIADHQVGLAEVLVGAAVLGIEAQRLVVVLEHQIHPRGAALPQRVSVEVVVVGVVRAGGKRGLHRRGGALPVVLLRRCLVALHRRIARRGHAGRAVGRKRGIGDKR
jgi:hypothetical protein